MSIAEELAEIEARVRAGADALAEARRLLGGTGLAVPARPPAEPARPPVLVLPVPEPPRAPEPPPAPPRRAPEPPAIAKPAPELPRIYPRILATCWGNRADEISNSWSVFAYSWAPRPEPGSGRTLLAAALPGRAPQGTTIDVRLSSGGPWVTGVLVVDVGPWRTRDDYFFTHGARPAAESMKGQLVAWDRERGGWYPATTGRTLRCNGAGVDLTPAVFAQLLQMTPQAAWSVGPSAEVDIIVRLPGAPVPAPATSPLPAKIRAAALALVGKPFPYAKETDGGRLGCADVVSSALINAGAIQPGERRLSVAGLEALLRERHGWRAVVDGPRDGDILIFDKMPGGSHGHVGIIVLEPTATGIYMVHNSSSERVPKWISLAHYERPVLARLRAPGA